MKRAFAEAPCPISLQVTLITLPCLILASHSYRTLTSGICAALPGSVKASSAES